MVPTLPLRRSSRRSSDNAFPILSSNGRSIVKPRAADVVAQNWSQPNVEEFEKGRPTERARPV